METEREDATRAEKTTSQEEVGDRCGAPEDPSAERLDDGACDGIGEGGEDGRESAGRSRRGQRRRRAVIIAAVVLIILGFGAGAWILSEAASVGEEAAGPDGSKDASEETVAVAFSVEADGWTEGSSPFLAHITGETSDGDAVDFWHAVWPDGTGSVVELPAGTYRISWTSAINADGSIYRVPGELTVGAGDTEIGGSFEQVPAEDVTQDDLDQILGEIGEVCLGVFAQGDDFQELLFCCGKRAALLGEVLKLGELRELILELRELDVNFLQAEQVLSVAHERPPSIVHH